jgi:hypothetical protein
MAAVITIVSDTTTLTTFPKWTVGALALQAGVGTIDLKPTLPAGIPSGGTFGSVAALPTGLHLTTAGVLSADAGVVLASTNIQFTYQLPNGA